MVPYPGYCLRRALGQGGFAEVWEAKISEGQRVALKFLTLSGEAARRELRSIQAVRQLRHPHLIRIDRVGCQPGYMVVVMERADASLLDLLDAYKTELGTPVAPEHVCQMLEQVAGVLDFLNAQSHKINGQRVAVQHRDVKPGNLLLFGETLKLSDFGTAALLTSPLTPCPPGGTVAYSAPEIFRGQVSQHTDQYALAVTYCQLRGGRVPFTNSPVCYDRSYVRPTPDLSMVPARERPVVARALAPLPGDRWRSCGELVARLLACQA
jgi:serine/threonine protein kinase